MTYSTSNIQTEILNKMLQLLEVSTACWCFFCSCFCTAHTWNSNPQGTETSNQKRWDHFTEAGAKSDVTEGEEWVMSFWCIQKGRGRREGGREREREKGSCPDKFLCVFFQSYSSCHKALDWFGGQAEKPTCWTRGAEGKEGHQFSCGAGLSTPSNINTFSGLRPQLTVRR